MRDVLEIEGNYAYTVRLLSGLSGPGPPIRCRTAPARLGKSRSFVEPAAPGPTKSANRCRAPSYNRNVLRPVVLALAAVCVLAGCGRSIENKEQVRADILDHLAKNTGLDLKSLDVDVNNVAFEKNQAKATVSFRPKGVSSINDGMVMVYTLQPKNGHWVVVGRADSQGHGLGASPANSGLPPGHPSVNGLPPGHPGVDGGAPSMPQAPGSGTGQTQ